VTFRIHDECGTCRCSILHDHQPGDENQHAPFYGLVREADAILARQAKAKEAATRAARAADRKEQP
jgi:ferredoxin